MKEIKHWEDSPSYNKRRKKAVIITLAIPALAIIPLTLVMKNFGFFLGAFAVACAGVVAFILHMNTFPHDYAAMEFDGQILRIPAPYDIMLDIKRPFQASYVLPETITHYIYERIDGTQTDGGLQLPWALLQVQQDERVISFYQEHGCHPGDINREAAASKSERPPLDGMVVYCNIEPLNEVFF